MRTLAWLKREIPIWKERGWIDEAGMHAILTHYDNKNPFGVTLVFSLFGALLLLLGLVLIIAHNWEWLGRFERSMIALFLLLFGQCAGMYGHFRARIHLAWRESLGIVWFFSIGASIAIIGQTYHLGGEFKDLLVLWLLLALPIPLILDSKATAILILAINTRCLLIEMEEESSHMVLLSGAFLLWVFYYVWRLRFEKEKLSNTWLGYALAIALLLLVCNINFQRYSEEFDLVTSFLLFSAILYMLGGWLHSDASILHRPFEVVGFLLLYVLLFFTMPISFWLGREEYATNHHAYLILYVLIGLLSLRDSHERLFLRLVPIFYILNFAIINHYDPMMAMITWSFILVCGAVYTMVLGAKKGSMSLINQGGVILIVGILVKFFESESSMIGRGVAFIVLGGIFLLLLRFSGRFEKRS